MQNTKANTNGNENNAGSENKTKTCDNDQVETTNDSRVCVYDICHTIYNIRYTHVFVAD